MYNRMLKIFSTISTHFTFTHNNWTSHTQLLSTMNHCFVHTNTTSTQRVTKAVTNINLLNIIKTTSYFSLNIFAANFCCNREWTQAAKVKERQPTHFYSLYIIDFFLCLYYTILSTLICKDEYNPLQNLYLASFLGIGNLRRKLFACLDSFGERKRCW